MVRKKLLVMVLILTAVMIVAFMMFFYRGTQTMKNSVFSWYEDYSENGFAEKVIRLCKKYSIDTVYQYVQKKNLSDRDFTAYVRSLGKEKIQTVLIYDEPEYDTDAYESYLKALQTSGAGSSVTGILVDIEPFSADSDANEETLEQYVSYMQQYGRITRTYGLKFMIAIPTWYNDVSQALTAELIDDADRTVLMNYRTSDFLEPVQFEVQTAVKADKEIENAVELQPADAKQGITENMTYADAGMKDVLRDLSQLHRTYGTIRGCFHHIRELYRMTYGEE